MHKESDDSPFWSCFLTRCWVSEQMSLRCRCVIVRNLTGLQASPDSSMKGTRTQQNTISGRIRQKEFTHCFYRDVISFAIGTAKIFHHLDWWNSFVFTCAECQYHWDSSLFLVPVIVWVFLFVLSLSVVQADYSPLILSGALLSGASPWKI